LEKIRQIRTSANSIGPIVAAMFIAATEKNRRLPTDFRVMLQNDSLKEYVARGTYIFPAQHGLRFSADVIEYCARHIPNWEPIEFCGYHVRDSGCNAVQEVAIALANGIAYINEVLRRGVEIDAFAPSLVVFLSSDVNILEEVAKFRATRRIWARMMRDSFKASLPQSSRLGIFCYTLGGALTAQQPLNNLVRVAYEALAAALGGVQTLATSSYDEALRLPSDEAATLALRTQQILAYETGVTATADPLGGSYFLETLTDELESRILAEMDRIQEIGGAVAAIDRGYYQSLIEESSYRLQMEIENGTRVKVGVNRFTDGEKLPQRRRGRSLRQNPAVQEEELKALADLRRTRDRTAWSQALVGVTAAARAEANMLPPILEAVRSYATIGEICGTLREVWGEYRQERSVV
jgi:methylmalonyl-CoA mutase N-terminal domain/subunit